MDHPLSPRAQKRERQRLVREIVSPDTSASHQPSPNSTTVRQQPLTAILSAGSRRSRHLLQSILNSISPSLSLISPYFSSRASTYSNGSTCPSPTSSSTPPPEAMAGRKAQRDRALGAAVLDEVVAVTRDGGEGQAERRVRPRERVGVHRLEDVVRHQLLRDVREAGHQIRLAEPATPTSIGVMGVEAMAVGARVRATR